MSEMRVIRCPCGATLTEDGLERVVAAAQDHAQEVHGQELSDEQARSMARPA